MHKQTYSAACLEYHDTMIPQLLTLLPGQSSPRDLASSFNHFFRLLALDLNWTVDDGRDDHTPDCSPSTLYPLVFIKF